MVAFDFALRKSPIHGERISRAILVRYHLDWNLILIKHEVPDIFLLSNPNEMLLIRPYEVCVPR